MTVTSLLFEKRTDWPAEWNVCSTISIIPVLIDPTDSFKAQVEVRAAGAIVCDAYHIAISFDTLEGVKLDDLLTPDDVPLELSLESSKILSALIRYGSSFWQQTEVETLISWDEGRLTVSPTILQHLDETLVIHLFAEGRPENIRVNKQPSWMDNIFRMEIEQTLSIDDHLASTEPRLLLANQRLYNMWHDARRYTQKQLTRAKNWLSSL